MITKFSLSEWLKDRSQQLETKEGNPVRILCCDKKGDDHPIAALELRNGEEWLVSYTIDGVSDVDDEKTNLFMVSPKPELSRFEVCFAHCIQDLGIPFPSEEQFKKWTKALLSAVHTPSEYEEDATLDAWHSGYTEGKQVGMDALAEEWKHGYDFAKKEMEDVNCLACDQHLKGYLAGRKVTEEEKQKEQKPVHTEDEREYVRTLKSLIADFLRGKEEVDRSYYQKIYDWLDDRHIEQKPADNPKWAELTWKDINELERIINNVHYEFQNGIGEDSFGELVLERFREYKDDGSMKEQKPAGWSEEDEKMLNSIIERGQAQIQWCDTGLKPEQVSWLKSLKPSEQKYTLADLEAEWKHGYDFAKKEMEDKLPRYYGD